MSYQVIARKFRPLKFDEVVGQDAIVKTLRNALSSNRLAHAYLFCGLRGTGKTTLARILAKAMNCQNLLPTIDPCGECESCKNFEKGQTIDFIEIDGASHRGIEDVKSLIDTVAYSCINRYKIILIDEVHMLTKEAFDALLKTLEEPPEHVKFIFATTEVHKLLPTILSRCQRYDLARIAQSALIAKLKKVALTLEKSVEEPVYELIADRAEGSLRDAESLFERLLSGAGDQKLSLETAYELLGYFSQDMLTELDLAFGSRHLKSAFLIADKLTSSGKDARLFFDQYRLHLRDMLCMKLSLDHFVRKNDIPKTSCDQYLQNELTYLIELLTAELKSSSLDKKIDVESLLLLIIQSKGRVHLSDIVEKLEAIALDSPVEPELTSREVAYTPPSPPEEASAPVISEPEIETKIQNVQVEEEPAAPLKKDVFYDTLMQFTAIELEGSLKK